MENCTFILTISCASHPPSMTGPNNRKNASQFASNCLMGCRFLGMAVHARLNSLTTHKSGNAKQFVTWRHRSTGNRANLSVIVHLSKNGISRISNVKGSLNQWSHCHQLPHKILLLLHGYSLLYSSFLLYFVWFASERGKKDHKKRVRNKTKFKLTKKLAIVPSIFIKRVQI